MFLIYSILTAIIIATVSTVLFFYCTVTLTKSASSKMETLVQQTSSSIDTMIDRMDTMSQTILFNKQLQLIMIDTLPYKQEDSNYFSLYPGEKSKVNSILFSLTGVKSSDLRISIFNGKCNYVTTSTYPINELSGNANLLELSYLKNIKQNSGNAILLPSHNSLWVGNETKEVFSFVRKFLFTWGNSRELGYIDIEQPFSVLEEICTSSLESNSHIMIVDQNGTPVYPVNDDLGPQYFEYYGAKQLTGAITIANPKSGQKELLYHFTSPKSQWTVFETMPQKEFMASVYWIQGIVIGASIILVMLALSIILIITNSLTKPIRQLRKSLQSISTETPSLSIDFKGNNNEIIQFQSTLNKAIVKLKDSMNETIEARSKEVEAHFLALQAQINPHFLYNSLMAISSVGQEYDNPKVVAMCTTLSSLLRYSISDHDSLVALEDEIRHTQNYINMIKFRYEENLNYEINICEEIHSAKIPKLLLQPLIENCFSHGFSNCKPPYFICISGKVEDDNWVIEITDNGCGFTSESLETFKTKQKLYDESIEQHDYTNELQVGGMGLLNVYIRLKLLFKENTIFELHNSTESIGTIIKIGGKQIEDKENTICIK